MPKVLAEQCPGSGETGTPVPPDRIECPQCGRVMPDDGDGKVDAHAWEEPDENSAPPRPPAKSKLGYTRE